jgi:glycosyltransferase involved in cell wall biosynthesis
VSAAEKRRLRAKLGLPEDTLILGCIGRSSEQKDPLTLYRAFAQAAERPIALLHVGKGELDDTLTNLVHELGIAGRVFRFAYTATPADFYRVIDGFILTSRYEGFSLALLEAMAMNLPVIHSDAPGNRDLLMYPLSHRWSAAPGNVDAFAHCIMTWHDRMSASDPDTINHRQIARARFDVRNSYGAVLQLYRSLMGKAPQPSASSEIPASAS